MIRKIGSIFVILAAMAAVLKMSARAEVLTLPITQDTSISCSDGELDFNQGKCPRIKMKGIENLLLLGIDPASLKNKVITKAILHIQGTDKNMMVRKVGFSTVAYIGWPEGNSEHDNKGTAGDSCFLTPELGSGKTWAGPGSNFLDVVWGHGGTFWTESFVQPDDQQWYLMEFDGRIVEAYAAGLSGGILVTDDNGETKGISKDAVPDTNYSNNLFFAHEQNASAPFLVVHTQAASRSGAKSLKVSVKPWNSGADFDNGGLELSWPGPRDQKEYKSILGYRIKITKGGKTEDVPLWAHPPLARPGERARALLKYPEAGARVTARVEVVGRGGVVAASGGASGVISKKLKNPKALSFPEIKNAPGEPLSNDLAKIWVIPDCTKANPITGNVQEEAGVSYDGDPSGSYRNANMTWSGKNHTVTLSAIRGEWVGFQVVCENVSTTSVTYKIQPGPLKGPGSSLIPAKAIELSKLWYVKVGDKDRDWYADPMLPLKAGDSFSVPDEKNAVPQQSNQTVYVEFFVPLKAKPGKYAGSLAVKTGDQGTLALKVNLQVAAPVMPKEAHFVFSMNAYNSPGGPYGDACFSDFNNAERTFYVMAHTHRTDLVVVHYKHNGGLDDVNCIAPPLTGQGKNLRVKDWALWDKRFGPLFDASAFKGTPREGVPLSHFFLVFSENYPTTMADGYKWNSSTWEDHWKVAGQPEDGFSQVYKDQWVALAKDYIKHFKQKHWKTNFLLMPNDKCDYKQYNSGTKKDGSGVSFWRMDEPMFVSDFEALGVLGNLLRQAQKGDRSSFSFRADISYPQWGRDVLDRVLDLNCSGNFTGYRRFLLDWRERYGERIWTYGGTPACTDSPFGLCAHALDLYSSGADGFAPWLVLGNEGNWTKFEDTSVIYTGKPMGIMGACASLRLKAYRRAEQDVEYVWLYAAKKGLLKNDPNRLQVAKALEGAIKTTKQTGKLDANGGAEVQTYMSTNPDDFEKLRLALVKAMKK